MRAPLPASVMFGVFVIMLAAIACGPNRRTQTLQATIHAVNAARDGFVAWDLAHQSELVKKAGTREEAVVAIDAYRTSREVIVQGFTAAYRGIAVAATQGDEASLRAALATADDLRKALTAIMGGL
jgi:hypothetical protein